jgi:hypothetical protein
MLDLQFLFIAHEHMSPVSGVPLFSGRESPLYCITTGFGVHLL